MSSLCPIPRVAHPAIFLTAVVGPFFTRKEPFGSFLLRGTGLLSTSRDNSQCLENAAGEARNPHERRNKIFADERRRAAHGTGCFVSRLQNGLDIIPQHPDQSHDFPHQYDQDGADDDGLER